MSRFIPLRVKNIARNTPDAVVIEFDTTGVSSEFNFTPGQYLTIEQSINGSAVRRSYSICSAVEGEGLKVAVKKVSNGKMSVHLNETLMEGDVLQVTKPEGHFLLRTKGAHVFFAAGSGITPIMSMIKAALSKGERCILHYGNRTKETTLFREELTALESSENLKIHWIYSQHTSDPLHSGRIDFAKTVEFVNQIDQPQAHDFYICGPAGMIQSVKNGLEASAIVSDSIHIEYFEAPIEKEMVTAPAETSSFEGTAEITVHLDDEASSFNLDAKGNCILDEALDQGLDAPFSCKGGVCTSCRAKLISGKVVMDANYALTEGEIEEGWILTCQSHPATSKVELTWDE